MQELKLLTISLLLLILFAITASAALPVGLLDNFAPVEGVVLMSSDGEVLIDATAINGVQSGDLFSVIGSSDKIIHPQSGQLLGERNRVTGLLQIIQVRPGFSITRQIAGTPPVVGTRVLRFEQVEARVFDLTDQGEAFYAQLQKMLPQLTWSGYERMGQAGFEALRASGAGFNGLLFVLDGERLELRSSEFELLRSYDNVDLQGATPLSTDAAVAVPVAIADSSRASTQLLDEDRLIAVWSGMAAKKLPVGLVVADLDGDGRQEIARAFEDRIEIGRLLGEDYERLQTLEVPSHSQALALSSLDLNKNGLPELYVTSAAKNGLNSFVIEFRNGKFEQILTQLNLFLNVTALPGEGVTLLGQEHDGSRSGFSPSVFRMKWAGSKLVRAASVNLPERGAIFSITAFDAASKKLARVNGEGRLEVTDTAGEPLWVSDASGASETSYSQPDPQSPSGINEMTNDVYLPPVLIALDDRAVMTLMNQGEALSSVFRMLSSVDVAVWRWDGIEMKRSWLQTLDGYVPAAVMADANNDGKQELALLLAFPTRNPFGSRKSVLRLYEIQ